MRIAILRKCKGVRIFPIASAVFMVVDDDSNDKHNNSYQQFLIEIRMSAYSVVCFAMCGC